MFTSKLTNGIVGTCGFALQDISRPDIKTTKSALMGTSLRIGDVDNRPTESMEIQIKLSKCTAIARPKSWKRFMLRKKGKGKGKDGKESSDETEDDAEEPTDVNEGDTYVELKKRSEYHRDSDQSDKDDDDDEGRVKKEKTDYDDARVKRDEELVVEDDRRVDREELIKGFKYGSTYTPCPDGQFDRLKTKKGIDVCGFFKSRNVRASRVHTLKYRQQPQIFVVSSRVGDGRSSIHLGRSRQSTATGCLVIHRAGDDTNQSDGNRPDGVKGRHGP
jgi:ATP-dependent DNA helicase 2 subunit 2